MSAATFVEVILPLATPKTYTYALPFDKVDLLSRGQRVVVQFGKRKFYTGIVFEIHQRKPLDYQAKLIEDIVEEEVLVNERQLAFWQWVSDYYLCTLGEVMAAALPSALKLGSESSFVFVENEDLDWSALNDEEFLL
ncbi:MAG: primosomal protein N', partial [Chitinophagales bacterium]|nr:primosomal protein N' [Chitinophagales bacterium]